MTEIKLVWFFNRFLNLADDRLPISLLCDREVIEDLKQAYDFHRNSLLPYLDSCFKFCLRVVKEEFYWCLKS